MSSETARASVHEADQTQLDGLAAEVFELMSRQRHVLVTAESCTAGLIAATLSRVPGMSRCLAGAFVVYQSESKTAWLDVPASLIERCHVVSREVAEAMAVQALRKTPLGSIAVSITGHLGPGAPADLDGVAWVGWSVRHGSAESFRMNLDEESGRIALTGGNEATADGEWHLLRRHQRQQRAVTGVLQFLCRRLSESA